MKDCPECHLVNPNGGLRCDCGYDFPSGTIQDSYLPPTERRVETNARGGYISDALLVPLLIYWLYQCHWMPHALAIALPLAQYGAIQAWRYRKHLSRRR
jgi:hypothetical protein